MKKNIRVFILLSALLSYFSIAVLAQLPNSWTQKSDFGGTARYGAVSFSIGSKGYIGTGYAFSSQKDFWEYDPATDSWSQKADFGGTARFYATGFSIGSKGYIGCGKGSIQNKDFWEYDPSTNVWTQKADFAGVEREGAVGFGIGTKGYVGTGLTGATTRLNDFWEYNPATDAWTQKSNVGTKVRAFAAGFSIGAKGYVGTGNSGNLEKDFWEYDPLTNVWVQKADFGGNNRFDAIGFSVGIHGYIGSGDTGGSFTKDFWEYDPTVNTWLQIADLGGVGRINSTGFGIGNKGYVGTGDGSISRLGDLWEYTPFCVPPAITAQPASQSIVYGSSATFTVVATDAITYQWQEDAGTGFADISNGGIYSNATTSSLTISLPTVSMTGYKYRCIVTGGCVPDAVSNGSAGLTVAAKAIVVTGIPGQNKIYGENDPSTFTYTFAPALVGTDIITGLLGRVPGENAGTYAFTLGSLVAGPNYTLSVAATPIFSILTAGLTITAENKVKCYDGSVFTAFTAAYSGFVNGDDQSMLAGTLLYGGSAATAINPGSYIIIPSGLSSANYAITYVNGSLEINVSPSPTISGPNSLCAGSTGITYTTEEGFTNYVWTISYGGIITGGLNSNTVTVDWGTAGSRSISVNYLNTAGCFSSIPATFNVQVKSVPVPIISGDNSLCVETGENMYETQVGYDDYTWAVSSGGTIVSGAGTPSINVHWTGSGNQTVSVDFTNELGCQSLSPTIFNVEVKPLPAAAGSVLGPASVCQGDLGVVYYVAPIAGAISYEWEVPTGVVITSGAGTPSISVDFSTSAIYGGIKVKGINDCGPGQTSPLLLIDVNPIPPTPVITQNGDTLTSSSDSGNQWFLDGIAIAGATGNKHIAVYIGTYHVEVILEGCGSAPSNSILVLPVSVNEVITAESFSIYPNPTSGSFNVKMDTKGDEVYSIEVYNNLGALIWKLDEITAKGELFKEIDMNGSPDGIYTLALRSRSNTVFKKFIISR